MAKSENEKVWIAHNPNVDSMSQQYRKWENKGIHTKGGMRWAFQTNALQRRLEEKVWRMVYYHEMINPKFYEIEFYFILWLIILVMIAIHECPMTASTDSGNGSFISLLFLVQPWPPTLPENNTYKADIFSVHFVGMDVKCRK